MPGALADAGHLHGILAASLLDPWARPGHDRFVDEDPLGRHLRLVAVEIGASLRRQLLEQVEAIAAHERSCPAINWPIDDAAVIRILGTGIQKPSSR